MEEKNISEDSIVSEVSEDLEEGNICNEDEPERNLENELEELSDRFLRMAAEYDNFRKRSAKEKEATTSYTTGYTAAKFLPILDNLERAISQETSDENYKKGVEMIVKQFNDCLISLNISEIEAEIGTGFNPDFHNAVMHIDDDKLGENTIAEVYQKGFKINDKVIRHTTVKVAN